MVDALAHVDPSDEALSAADLFIAAKAPVVFASPELYKAASNLALIKGEAVSVPLEANAKGVVLMGLVSDGHKFKEMVSGHTKVLYAIGEVPVSKRPDTGFLVVQASHMTDLATDADVVLPAAHALEAVGTVVDFMGRLKEVKKTVEPAGEARTHSDIFAAVAKAMGSSLKPVKDTEVKKALKTRTKVSFSPFKKDKNLDVDSEQFINDINKSTIHGSRLLWLKELDKTVAV